MVRFKIEKMKIFSIIVCHYIYRIVIIVKIIFTSIHFLLLMWFSIYHSISKLTQTVYTNLLLNFFNLHLLNAFVFFKFLITQVDLAALVVEEVL